MPMVALQQDYRWFGRVAQDMVHNVLKSVIDAAELGDVRLLFRCLIPHQKVRWPERYPGATVRIERCTARVE